MSNKTSRSKTRHPTETGTKEMKKIACAAMGILAALGFAPLAGADPTAGHYTIVTTQSPAMACVIGSDDDDPGTGPNVVCQGDEFPGSPVDPTSGRHLHQVIITAAGKLTYRDANIPMGGDDYDPRRLSGGVYHLQGWTIEPTVDDVTFTNDATGHGMTVSTGQKVTAF